MIRLAAALSTAVAFLLAPSAAQAQSPCPAIQQGAVLTAAQWQNCFQSKQDFLGFAPINPSNLAGAAPITVTTATGPAGILVTVGMQWTGLNAVTESATLGSWWSDVSPFTASPIFRMRDRACVDDGCLISSALGAPTPPLPNVRSGTDINVIGDGWAKVPNLSSLYVLSSQGHTAVAGQVTTSVQQAMAGGFGSMSAIGVLGQALANNSTITAGTVAWGGYFEGMKGTVNNNDQAFALEIAVDNGFNSVVPWYIYQTGTAGATHGIQIDCGGPSTGTYYTCSAALNIVSAGSSSPKFDRGIVFNNNSVATQGSGLINAINFPSGHDLVWWRNNASTDEVQAYIGGADATGGDDVQSLVFGPSSTATLNADKIVLSGNGSGSGGNVYGGVNPASIMTVNATTSGSPSSSYLKLQTNGQFTAIGTNFAPSSVLLVSQNATAPPAALAAGYVALVGADSAGVGYSVDTFATNGTVTLRRANGTNASPSGLTTNDVLGALAFRGYVGTNGYTGGAIAQFACAAAEAWSNSTNGAYCRMLTTPTGGGTITESMRWLASGGVAIGNTIDPAVGGLDLNGQFYMPNIATSSAAQTGTVCWTSGGSPAGKFTADTSVGCLSSLEEAKDIEADLSPAYAMSLVERLRPFSFRYRKGWGDDGHYEQFGLGAHQVAAVDERMVGRDLQGNLQGVRYMELTAVLAAAIQELKADNDNLRAELKRATQRR